MSLDTFVTEPRMVAAGGKQVAVAPLRVRQIPPFARAIAPAMSAIAGGHMQDVIIAHGESLVRAVAIATGESEEWLGDLTADEFLALASAVVEVNADFFGQRVAPMLERAAQTMAQALSGVGANTAGPTPSPSSAPSASGSTNA